MRTIVTGSSGLIGSESPAREIFLNKNYKVIGIDNNLRKYFFFFGKDGDRMEFVEFKKI